MIDGGVKRVADITVINTVPTTVLSAYVLKQMSIRKRGVIVNLASAAAYHTMFYWAVYSATKV
jgi:short-subunit dehydrogenase